ncbi:MAG: DNA-processing protein DprA [Candidatus Jorgensenbacteria bacterium]|nr:DNA-processing protein DprA [Candidatus Jorgensenbacteria bacterium]
MTQNIFSITANDALYPPLLREIPGAPQKLYYRGEIPRAWTHTVAIVGTRKATRDGILTAREIARDLASRGVLIISGLALGIDAAAHEGALAGGGKTYAVLANGLDTIYPPSHESLARQILETGGCIFSEYPEGTPSYPSQFLERNRIVSGLSLATVVIEAPERSGALVTARNAIEQGRDVFIIPGPVHHSNYRGSHFLVREGARLVTSAEDIIRDLGIEAQKKLPEFSSEQVKVFSVIKEQKVPLDVDRIAELVTLEPHVVQSALTFLSLEGYIEEASGKFCITKTL